MHVVLVAWKYVLVRARAIASREDRATRVQTTVNASIPILYAKWDGSPDEFARERTFVTRCIVQGKLNRLLREKGQRIVGKCK